MENDHIPSHLKYMKKFCTRCVGLCPIRELIYELGSCEFVDLGSSDCRNIISSCMGADSYFNRGQEPLIDAVSKKSTQPSERPIGFNP